MRAPALSLVEPEGDALIDHGDARPLIPDGIYNAVYVRHEVANLRRFGNAPKVFIWFRIVDSGPAFDTKLFRAYRVQKALGKRRFVVKRDSELLIMLARVLQIKRRPDRISLLDLKGCVLSIRVGTVTKTSTGNERPEWLQYSTVRDILTAETALHL